MLDELNEELVMLGYGVKTYSYYSPKSKERHRGATTKPTGEVILWDVVHKLNDLGHRVKIEPRSVYRPEMLIKPLIRYFTPVESAVNELAFKHAFEKVRRMFYVGKLEPSKLGMTNFDAPKNSGAPFFSKKGDVFEEALAEAKALLNDEVDWPPTTVFYRSKDTEVARPVFGYPFSMSLIEQCFSEPYQKELMIHRNPYVGGRRHSEIAGALNEIRWKSDWIGEFDYSGFDGSLSPKLIGSAFRIVRNCFKLTSEEMKAFDLVAAYFVHSDTLLPNGMVVTGRKHGVPSGSMFTQIIDSICNALIIEYVRYRLDLKQSRYLVLGDDSVVGGYGEKPSLKSICDVALELGVSLNLSKSSIGYESNTKTKFLGHYWQHGVVERPAEETLSRLVAPERVDNRLWGRSEDGFKKRYLQERVRAYQDDNLAIWGELTELVDLLEYPTLDLHMITHARNSQYFYSGGVVSATWVQENLRELRRSGGSRLAIHL